MPRNKRKQQSDGGDGDGDDGTSSKSKIKKHKRSNPLAQARGQQKAPANVWFRRSGAGYRLFVEYYSSQPLGVVVPVEDATTSTTVIDDNISKQQQDRANNGSSNDEGDHQKNHPSSSSHQGGMSRAAQRRRKRNNGTAGGAGISSNPPKTETTTSVTAALQTHLFETAASTQSSPLLQAAAAAATNTSCLKNNKNNNTSHQILHALLPFFQAMSRPLPTTFRIRHSATPYHCKKLLQDIKELNSHDDHDHDHDTNAVAVTPIPIQEEEEPSKSNSHDKKVLLSFPRLWECKLAKHQLSAQAPKLKELLLAYSQNGTLARQELGSMLPVLALNMGGYVRAGDCIVDMCASPGSKTLQAVEQVVVVASARGKGKERHPQKQGLVLANDVLESRLHALRAAVRRSGVPETPYTERIRYSQVDATKLSLSAPCDAVICDVPCSGDGTCRKDPHILPMWKPQAGNALHSTQLAILKRSLELVKVGGVVCYSTCSLNPVEDEAVVAAALTSYGAGAGRTGNVELIDLTGLKGWKHRPGVTTWKVAHYVDDAASAGAGRNGSSDKDDEKEEEELARLTWYESHEEAKAAGEMKEAVSSMWPSTPPSPMSNHTTNTVADSLHLDRCARLLPQDYDSGGFFLALLKKCK